MPVQHIKGQAGKRTSGVRHIRRTKERLAVIEQQAEKELAPVIETTIGVMEARRQAEAAGLTNFKERIDAALESGAITGANKSGRTWQIAQSQFTTWLVAQDA
jgi:hypothetical protein